MLKISIILASTRIGRQSHKPAKYLLGKLNEISGISAELLDLAEYNFPILEERLAFHPHPSDKLKEFSGKLTAADSIIFVSPEYNSGYSGVLKNTVDYFRAEFGKKPIGVVAVSAGALGGINASTQMQLLILGLGAYPMPLKLLIPSVQKAFDEQGKLSDPAIEKNSDKFLSEFIWFSEAIKNRKQNPA
ncbi:MAG TPA: NAD(P)H-dependent oxidoreductase [Cytophagaceae bacterium]|jgi:azobenzene reductase|nr:NAD(P)H-dependent oxidoreductase [Cytophagaceae bacterium]